MCKSETLPTFFLERLLNTELLNLTNLVKNKETPKDRFLRLGNEYDDAVKTAVATHTKFLSSEMTNETVINLQMDYVNMFKAELDYKIEAMKIEFLNIIATTMKN